MTSAILLIEDDEMTAALVASALERGECVRHVHRAVTIDQGLRTLDAEQIEGVVVDYRLPDGDGLSALRSIRARRPELPAIMLTAQGSEEIAVEAMKSGAADYVVKSGQYLDRLSLVVRAALGHRHLRPSSSTEGTSAHVPV